MIPSIGKKKIFRISGSIVPFWPLGLFLFLFFTLNFYFGFDTYPVFSAGDADKFKWGIYWRMSSIFLIVAMAGCYAHAISVVLRNYDEKKRKWAVLFCVSALVGVILPMSMDIRFDAAGNVGITIQKLIEKGTKLKIPDFIKLLNFSGAAVFTVITFSSHSILFNGNNDLSTIITNNKRYPQQFILQFGITGCRGYGSLLSLSMGCPV